MDVNDAFYAAEQEYYDEIGPKLSDLSYRLDRLLLDSPHRAYLEEILGQQAIAVMEKSQLGFDSRLIPHMFQWPFYAIDYALAQVCALEYYQWACEDREAAWQSYLLFCRKTGTESFPRLVSEAGLRDLFAAGMLRELTA